MDNIDTWKVDNKHNNKEFTLYINNNPELRQRHLLDITKSHFTLLEKFIYDTSLFHFNRLNIDKTDDYYIEFCCKSKYADDDNNIYIDCDQELKKTNNYYFPLLSCITYFTSNTNTPIFISNIDLDTYKYKNFENQQSIMLSLPKINKQITFDGHFYHGNVALTEHDNAKELYTMSINLWNKKPKNVEYYIPKYDTTLSNKEDIITTFDIDNDACNIKVSEDIINYNFFNSILYDKQPDVCYIFNELITNYVGDAKKSTFVFEVDKSIKRKARIDNLKNTYGDMIDDFEEIVNGTNEFKYNRFLQRFEYENIFSQDVCHYIINELFVYVKQNKDWNAPSQMNNMTNAININYMPSIFGIIKTIVDNAIFNKIINAYNLDYRGKNINAFVVDLFIVTIKRGEHNSLKTKQGGGFFTFTILLSSNFKGCGLQFDDGLTANLKQGDMLIYNSNINLSVLPITDGTCHFLVGFIDLQVCI